MQINKKRQDPMKIKRDFMVLAVLYLRLVNHCPSKLNGQDYEMINKLIQDYKFEQ